MVEHCQVCGTKPIATHVFEELDMLADDDQLIACTTCADDIHMMKVVVRKTAALVVVTFE
jgi:hypothetical protein